MTRRAEDGRTPLLAWLLFAAAVALYAATLFPGVGNRHECGDSAKLQFIGSVRGVLHPPGSPLYVLATWLWVQLPLPGATWLAVELFSALCGAGAVTLLYLVCRRLGLGAAASLLGVAVLAVSRSLWSFSTEAELYAPMAFAMAFVLHRLLVWHDTRRARDYWLACAAFALGFGNHLMMVSYLPAFAFFVLAVDWKTPFRARNLAALVVVLAVALLPWAWLWARIADAPYSEYPGARTWPGFLDFILARQYRGRMFSYDAAGWWFERPAWGLEVLAREVSLLILVLALIGMLALFARDRRRAGFVVLAFLGPFLMWVWYRGFDEMGGAVSALVALAVCIAAGLARLECELRPLWLRALGAAVVVVAALPSCASTVSHFRKNSDPRRCLIADAAEQRPAYYFDIECVVAAAEPATLLVPPVGAYGHWQVLKYHQFANPVFAKMGLRFAYRERPPAEFVPWVGAQWNPCDSAAKLVYVYREHDAGELRAAGFQVEERTLDLAACGEGRQGTMRYFRASR